jgi:hypothetical protein
MDNQNRQGIGRGDKVEGGAGPGSDNPALEETYAEKAGEISTADLLRMREGAEEQELREQGAEMYAEQSPTARPEEHRDADAGRPNWPADRDRNLGEYMESPRAQGPLLSGSGAGGGSGIDTQQLQGEADALADRAGTEASKGESRARVPSPGADEDLDTYAEREFGNPTPPSEMDMLAPGMVNVPPEGDDGR